MISPSGIIQTIRRHAELYITQIAVIVSNSEWWTFSDVKHIVAQDELENIKFHMAHKTVSCGALLAGLSTAHPRLWLAGEHLREMQPL